MVTGEHTVETSAQRVAAGLRVRPEGLVGPTGFDWNDTQLGVLRDGASGRYVFFASDGSCHGHCNEPRERDGSITRTVGTLERPLGAGRPLETILPHDDALPPHFLYAGGGPAYRIPAGAPGAGAIIVVYHAERATYLPGYHYPDCDSTGFCNAHQHGIYSYLGLASSLDDGITWRDMGLIVGANVPYSPQQEFDVGDGNLIVEADPATGTGRFFAVYFPDLLAGPGQPAGLPTRMSVARVDYNGLATAVANGQPAPAFAKYHDGGWSEPGLGGASTDLLAGVPGLGTPGNNHFDMETAWNAATDRYAAFLGDGHTIRYTESADGLRWSAATVLKAAINESRQVANYPTPVGLGSDPAVLGRHFSIYYDFQQYSGPGAGWPSAELRRIDVVCQGVGAGR